MKQMAFMLATCLLGTAGAFALSPVYGVAVYYLYAVLRPQFIWDWVEVGPVRMDGPAWSFYVGVCTLGAAALWRLRLLAPGRMPPTPWYGEPPLTRSHLLFLLFTGWIGLTYVTAENTDRAWPFFVEYVKIFVMFGCATLVLRTVADLWLVYLVTLGAAVYVAYEINASYLASGWLMLSTRGYGGLDNNGAALMLAMAAPMCFFAWEGTRHRLRWLYLLALPPLLHAVLLSYSRGAMLSLLVAAPVVFLRTRHKRLVAAVFAGLLLCLPVAAGPGVRDRFLSIGQHEVDESANSRKTTWLIAARMATERPLFGFGIRNSNLFTFDYGADIPGRSIHSQYLQTAADSGWVGLGLYLAVLVSVFLGLREARRTLRGMTDPAADRARAMAAGVEAGLVLFGFGAIFLSLEHFEMPYILMLLAVQLHAVTRAVASAKPRVAALPLPVPRPVAGAVPA